MKKGIIKFVCIAVLLSGYFYLEPVKEILSKEINTIAVTNFLAKNLYRNEESVSSTPLYVKDYLMDGNRLYIFPLKNEITLPMDVMIVSVADGSMEVVNLDERYRISNVDQRKSNLYQYIHSKTVLGYTNDFFIVEGDNLDRIAGRLLIEYEKI